MISEIPIPLRDANDDTIIFHFDVSSHSIPVGQFVDTANATLAILENFNEELFEKKVKYELRVLPPEKGGLQEIFQLLVGFGVGGFVWTFINSEIGKAYLKGLTGREPAFWAERLGQKTREKLGRRLDKKKPSDDRMMRLLPFDDSDDISASGGSDLAPIEAAIFATLVVHFLLLDPDKLEKIGLTKEKFRKAYSAKNKVFEACSKNKEVKGLSFDHSHEFQIPRQDFPKQIAKLPAEEKTSYEEPDSWNVEIVDVLANSPNWQQDGRKWQGKAAKYGDQPISFDIEDNGFWHHVKIKDIQAAIGDNMRVQWAYPSNQSRPSHVRVLRVLSFNGRELSKPLTQQQLDAILQNPTIVQQENRDLFDTADSESVHSDTNSQRIEE